MPALKAKINGQWVTVGGDVGPQGPAGLPGPPGVASIIVGDFGALVTPASLPPDGLIPVDWDGPDNPSVAYQMNVGESLYYDKPGDPLDGHLFQYTGTAIDPAGWLDIGLIQGPAGMTGPRGPQGIPGPVGPPGVGLDEMFVGPDDPTVTVPTADVWYDTDEMDPQGAGVPAGGLTDEALIKLSDVDGDVGWGQVSSLPVGGLAGELLVKTGPADGEVGWATGPRVACRLDVAEILSSATAQAFFTLCSGPITINPDRMYHFMAGIRCIQDPGQGCFANLRVVCGSVTLVANDVISCTDPNAYWGSWSQNWLRPGSDFTAATADLTVKLEANISVASKMFYAPRIYVIEF